MKKLKAKQKKLIWILAAVLAAAGIGAGIFFGTRGGGEPVGVYSFYNVGMTEFWGDTQESYGPVTTDRIQTVFLTDTQTVTEVKVAQGDTVKKGDILFSYDTTLSDLQLERKRLEVEKFKLQMDEAKKKLEEIKRMVPMQEFSFDFPTEEEGPIREGVGLSEPFRVSDQHNYDGSAPEKSLICWLRASTPIDDNVLETIRQQAERLQEENGAYPPDEIDPYPEYPDADDPLWEEDDSWEDDTWAEDGDITASADYRVLFLTAVDGEYEEPDYEEPDYEDPDWGGGLYVSDFYVVFKITEGDMSLGGRQVWQGAHVFCTEYGFAMKLFNANGLPDYTLVTEEQEPEELPNIDMGSGLTASQIKELRLEQEKKIKDLELQQKMSEAEYKIMQAELGDGNIYAQIDGQVISLIDAEEAKDTRQPMVKVSGGGGFYIRGSVSELVKDQLQPGQEVQVNDWNSGMVYTGTVQSVGDFPGRGNGWGMGNPNATYYPFTVFVDGDADLQEGSYASIQYTSAASEGGIYLENPFVRTENGVSYVMVRGADGKLEKREVTVGKSIWGYYTEIRSGNLTADDYIAFPYGKNVKPGAPTEESDLSSLYSY